MKKTLFIILLALLAVSCKTTKKQAQYGDIYKERPSTVYVAPLADMSMRRAFRTTEDSAYNHSLNVAACQLYLTAADPLVYNGYYVPGPLVSAQIAATETRSGRQLRNDVISDYAEELGVDAILFITLNGWSSTENSWTVEVEYVLRSTRTGNELMHTSVVATKTLSVDFKKRPVPTPADKLFAEQTGYDLETVQRCRLVETLNKYVLKDLPSGKRAREHRTERFIPSHPEYFSLRIEPDESVELVKNDMSL